MGLENHSIAQGDETPKPMVRRRITSIDALRAFTLFGILLVHVAGMFGWSGIPVSATAVGRYSHDGILFSLSNRCAPVFTVLFGISFYLILLNPTYTTRKFVWRCFLLALIGLFNKIFYTYDALLWYGIWGMVLAGFRHLPVKKLWVLFVVMFVLNLVIKHSMDLGVLVFGTTFTNTRYVGDHSLADIVTYPVCTAAYDYVHITLKGGFLYCLSLFLLGYCIGRSGIIEKLDKYVTIKNLLLFTVPYVVFVWMNLQFHLPVLKSIGYLCGAFCYALFFLLLYYRAYPFFRFLEPYGKLGLTNYSMQGIMGVILTSLLFIPRQWPFEYVLASMLLFYVLQVVFSIVWLKHHKYGPLEWLWRCATERKWFTNKC